MNIAALTALLTSCLPFLIKLGEKSAESAASKIGEQGWEKAKKIWEKLQPKLREKKDFKVAAEQVAAKSDSEARKAVFQEELAILLKENPELAESIFKIMEDHSLDDIPSTHIDQRVTGDKNQVIGQMTDSKLFGDITGNITISE